MIWKYFKFVRISPYLFNHPPPHPPTPHPHTHKEKKQHQWRFYKGCGVYSRRNSSIEFCFVFFDHKEKLNSPDGKPMGASIDLTILEVWEACQVR